MANLIEFTKQRLAERINPTDRLLLNDLIKEIETHFLLTIDEAKALNYLLKLHNGLLKQNEEQYVQILRLINGLGTFLDQHDIR